MFVRMGVRNQIRWLSLWTPVAVYMALIYGVSAQSDAAPPAAVSDTLAHAVVYVGLAVVVVRALAGGLPARVTRGIAGTALVVAIGYGATDEWHQLFVPGRVGELHDLYADAFGACAGVVACWVWGILRFRYAD